MRTFKVIEPPDFEQDGTLTLGCEHCGQVAECPTHGPQPPIIFVKDMTVVTDPGSPEWLGRYLPPVIQCRKCRRVYEWRRRADVRQAV